MESRVTRHRAPGQQPGTNTTSNWFYPTSVSLDSWEQQMKKNTVWLGSGNYKVRVSSWQLTTDSVSHTTQCQLGQRKQKLAPVSRPRPCHWFIKTSEEPGPDISGRGGVMVTTDQSRHTPGQMSAPAPEKLYVYTTQGAAWRSCFGDGTEYPLRCKDVFLSYINCHLKATPKRRRRGAET